MTTPTTDELLPALHEIQWIPGKHYATQLDEHYERLHAAYMALRAELAGAEERGAARERLAVITHAQTLSAAGGSDMVGRMTGDTPARLRSGGKPRRPRPHWRHGGGWRRVAGLDTRRDGWQAHGLSEAPWTGTRWSCRSVRSQ